ncbi:MAG: hypothetical protein PW792_05305 [Acidobacteriaceae bacterium]|nr:hypothetical protein [Acidobacteriaceae bacterium]
MRVVSLDKMTGDERREIDQELERLLSHTLFRHSRRLPAFLQFVVHESLAHGEAAPLKERTLGVEVFGRKPDYDTNADPIVRVTATELRKKLAQYYYTDGRDDGIHIELPSGTYLPLYRRPAEAVVVVEPPALEVATVQETAAAEEAMASAHAAVEEQTQATLEAKSSSKLWRVVACALVLLLVAALAGYIPLLKRNQPTQVGAFWAAFLGSSDSAIIVMPVIRHVPAPDSPERPSDVSVAPNLSIEDTTIAARVAGRLERENLKYWLASSSEISFSELRTGPAIFIGALDNAWTLRLTKDLPFHFEESPDGRTGRIVAKDGKTQWAVDITTPHQRIAKDYGIVAKFHSPLSGEPSVIIAGISSQGTQAAGELLTSPQAFKGALRDLKNAENFEAIVETEAVDGKAGPPHVIAFKTW